MEEVAVQMARQRGEEGGEEGEARGEEGRGRVPVVRGLCREEEQRQVDGVDDEVRLQREEGVVGVAVRLLPVPARGSPGRYQLPVHRRQLLQQRSGLCRVLRPVVRQRGPQQENLQPAGVALPDLPVVAPRPSQH